MGCGMSERYEDRLVACSLKSLELRRLLNDLILCFKIVHKCINLTFSDFLNWILITALAVITLNYAYHYAGRGVSSALLLVELFPHGMLYLVVSLILIRK